jgi:hypothetical protein
LQKLNNLDITHLKVLILLAGTYLLAAQLHVGFDVLGCGVSGLVDVKQF